MASRRAAEKLMAEGRVTVDGQVISHMGAQVEPGQDVRVDGRPALPEAEKCYIMYHKPAGEVTTVTDPEGRATVLDKFRDFPVRLYPVGRLDYDSEGLLLLTNDGPLAHALLAPGRHVDKVYYVEVDGRLDQQDRRAFQAGVPLADGTVCQPADLTVLDPPSQGLVTLREGKYHQVKRMLAARGKPVTYLKRLSMGPLTLDPALPAGAWRPLTPEEKASLGR